ncbi:hypothetical protein [Nocardia sp. CY41]|uniref:hypothetical protein n=1 Tax=Nocardia sp. CY41 TaxID=2608686 RepID=UPI00135A50EA|nr:hypothetical protein [Nocardia sp. CY41]
MRTTDESSAARVAATFPDGQGPRSSLESPGAVLPQTDVKPKLPVRRRPGEIERLNAQIGKELTDRHGIEVYGFDMPGVDTGTVREIVTALDEMLAKYPHTRILSVDLGDVEGDIARALEDRAPHTDLKATRITFSAKYATDPELLSKDVTEAVERKHFFQRSQGPAYSAIVHEFGHALTYAGRSAAVDRADSHLFEHYLRTHDPENLGGDISEPCRIWRDQLSGYSFWKGGFHPIEALAEAFADVELNGEHASEPARVLRNLLVETAESEWRKEGLI